MDWQSMLQQPCLLFWLTVDQHRSIGVSNFGVKDLEILLASAKIKPAANQVREQRD
jgi:hypothetical protein